VLGIDWPRITLPRVENQFIRGCSAMAPSCLSPCAQFPESAGVAFVASKLFQAEFDRTVRNSKTLGSQSGIAILFRSPIQSGKNSAFENLTETTRGERSAADRNDPRFKSQERIVARFKSPLAPSLTDSRYPPDAKP
jgi:hypothetical protein